MRLNQREPGYTDAAADCIEALGGKLGGVAFATKQDVDLNALTLPTVTVLPDQEWDGTLPPHNGKVIVRASHKNDFQGLVDALVTKVVSPEHVRDVIDEIREQAACKAVMAFGISENPSYDGRVTIGIQPYAGDKRGSIVEHPNRRGEYVISLVQDGDRLAGPDIYATGIYNSKNGVHLPIRGGRAGLRCASSVVEAYKRVRNLRQPLVRDDLSFQMEFVHDDERITNICQLRAFVPFDPAQNFDVPNTRTHKLVFGVTPPEGIVLPLFNSPDGCDAHDKPLAPKKPWALLKTFHSYGPSLKFDPKSLGAYLVCQTLGTGHVPSLEHNHYSLAQKADVTVFEEGGAYHNLAQLLFCRNGGAEALEEFKAEIVLDTALGRLPRQLRNSAGSLNMNVRVICNGRNASVQVEPD